jgi:undecaprenyl-diphosphatase
MKLSGPDANTLKQPVLEIRRDLRAVREARWHLLVTLAFTASLLALFAWLSEEVFEGEMQQFDSRIRAWVHGFTSPQMTKLMQALTFLGSMGFLFALFLISIALFLRAGLKRAAIWLAVATGGSLVLDLSLKLAFHRVRPVPFFGKVPLTYSFPSGHALSSLCFYFVLAGLCCTGIHNRAVRISIGAASVMLVAGIGLSRIYLGVHFPTDVVAGYLAGTLWVMAVLFAGRIRRPAPNLA